MGPLEETLGLTAAALGELTSAVGCCRPTGFRVVERPRAGWLLVAVCRCFKLGNVVLSGPVFVLSLPPNRVSSRG